MRLSEAEGITIVFIINSVFLERKEENKNDCKRML
jgi:hypothetical protein